MINSNRMMHTVSLCRKDGESCRAQWGGTRSGLAWEVPHRVSWAGKRKDRGSLASRKV